MLRDHAWGTVNTQVHEFTAGENSNLHSWSAQYSGRAGALRVDGHIELYSQETSSALQVTATGTAQENILTARTGFVTLHSLGTSVGHAVQVTSSTGTVSHTLFPELIDGQQPIKDIAELCYTTQGQEIKIRFDDAHSPFGWEMEAHLTLYLPFLTRCLCGVIFPEG